MDLQQLQERALRAREFVETIEGRSFTLRIPTRHESLVEARRLGGRLTEDLAGMLLLQRAVLERAVVGWAGVTVGDVLLDAPEAADPVPFEPGAVGLLIDAKPAWAERLVGMLAERTAERNARLEAEAKN